MTELVPPNGNSPFDALRHEDEEGPYWLAREICGPLGYTWRRFTDAIDRGRIALKMNGQDPEMYIRLWTTPSTDNGLYSGERARTDYRMTREGVDATIQGGDPRKPEIAAGWAYYRGKTREAELHNTQPTDDLALMEQTIAAIRADRRRITAIEQRLDTTEAKISAQAGEYNQFTCLAYAKLNDLPTDRPWLSRLGKHATAIMRTNGQEPHTRQDATFGAINLYPVDILAQALAQLEE